MAVPPSGMEGVSLAYAMSLPPKDAISYLESKGAKLTFNWHDVWQKAQAQAFTVAGVARLDILEDIRGALKTALAEGKTGKWFRQELEGTLRAKGWWGKRTEVGADGKESVVRMGSPARLDLIYRQNMQTAYMAGRYKQMLENADNRPFWRYVAVLDQRTRPAHRLLNGRTFRYDDAFWSTHYPPNGWGCRCRVQALSELGMEREGLTPESGQNRMVTRQVDVVDRRTGEVTQRQVTGYRTVDGPDSPVSWTDPGFSYHPGQAAYGLDMEAARKLSLVQDTGLHAQAVQKLNNSPLRWENFANWVDAVWNGARLNHATQVVGFLKPEHMAFIKSYGEQPPILVAISKEILDHAKTSVALTREELRQLPELFCRARILRDLGGKTFVFVVGIEKDMAYCLSLSSRRRTSMPWQSDVLVEVCRVRSDLFANADRYLSEA